MATGDLVEDRQNDLHAFLKPLGLVADHVGRDLDLVIGVGVHEVIAVRVSIEEVEILVLDERALHLLGGLKPVCHLDPVGKASHVDLGCRRAFARMKALGGKNDANCPSSRSMILPLRIELAITLTSWSSELGAWRSR